MPLKSERVNEANEALTTGEKPTEALYKPHSLGELHVASCSRCSRQCYAKYV